jgi:hypothetical protein
MEQNLLDDLMDILNEDATNYTVFLQSYDVHAPATRPSEDLIKEALGPNIALGEIKEIDRSSVWPVVEEALTYIGDSGAGPSAAAIASDGFRTALGTLRNQIDLLVKGATHIEEFWLKHGHPAYPVFWDFAFILRTKDGATVLLGSSSD